MYKNRLVNMTAILLLSGMGPLGSDCRTGGRENNMTEEAAEKLLDVPLGSPDDVRSIDVQYSSTFENCMIIRELRRARR